MIWNSYCLITGPKVDSSVRVSHLDREVILMLLKARGWVQKDYKTPVLMNILAKVLKNRHAIHDELKMLSNYQLAELCREFSLPVKGQKYRPRMIKALSIHFFEDYPDAPLTNLQRVLKEFISGEIFFINYL